MYVFLLFLKPTPYFNFKTLANIYLHNIIKIIKSIKFKAKSILIFKSIKSYVSLTDKLI